MFFAKLGEYEPCGMFSTGHFILLAITAVLIGLGLFFCRRTGVKTIRLIIRIITAVLWALEIAKILFVLLVTNAGGPPDPNNFVPLYYCSLILYAGLLSSLGRGWVQRLGDVFIATGGIIGGACFLIVPNTSLRLYPMFHFLSFHSFLLHGLMVFLGILLLVRGVCKLRMKDLTYCAGLISVMCVLAVSFNEIWNRTHPGACANLMFMSHDFPNTPVALLYKWTSGPPLFSIMMWLIQAFIPFLAVFGVYRLVTYVVARKKARGASRVDD